MTVHTTGPTQPTTSTNATLESIRYPPKEADHRMPRPTHDGTGAGRKQLVTGKGGAGTRTGDPEGKLNCKGGGG